MGKVVQYGGGFCGECREVGMMVTGFTHVRNTCLTSKLN